MQRVSTISYGSKLVQSIKWIFMWILLFFGSFFVLFWNEWRQDISLIAQTAEKVTIQQVQEANQDFDQKLLAVAWTLQSNSMVWDWLFLKDWMYLQIERNVEMFAREENIETTTEKKLWWSEEQTETISYKKVWTSNPEDSSWFADPTSHTNPSLAYSNANIINTDITLNWISLSTNDISLPASQELRLTQELLIIDTSPVTWELAKTTIENWYLFIWVWTSNNPEIWDVRIKYRVIPSDLDVTLFAKFSNGTFWPYIDWNNNLLYRAFTSSADAAIKTLHDEHTMMTWILRAVWFMMMWMWLQMMLWLISTLLDVIPFLWNISSWLTQVITWILALCLSLITIIIAKVFHNRIALVIVLVWLTVFLWRTRRNNKSLPWWKTYENTEKETETKKEPEEIIEA